MLYTARDITIPNWGETINVSDITAQAEAGLSISGNGFDNRIVGGEGKDTLLGRSGADNIDGFRGGDSLNGGSSKDEIYGNYGRDILTGYNGNDIGKDKGTFVFNHSASDVTFVTVLDFEKGVDALRLERPAWRNASVTTSGVDTIVKAGVQTVILEYTADVNLSRADFIIIN